MDYILDNGPMAAALIVLRNLFGVLQERRSQANSPRALTQAKLTSLYGNFSKANNNCSENSVVAVNTVSEDCMLVDKVNSFTGHQARHVASSSSKREEEKASPMNNLGSKRLHTDISSSCIDLMKSPSTNDETDADQSRSSFVTARAKLVTVTLCL